ncbi:MAG: DNA polymerase III subunit gamma/tau, partial [Desulfovibrio sp.]|nr:DNA polymerase III subunit gamma/tau [Desulfovibrio sp.]
MSTLALTAKYRPQTFAEVTGQDTVKTILSRTAREDRAAPAYLFSGTRGVGKTTLARVFAKALNCRRGPAAEPCNGCDLCRAVTAGNAVDVVEIDGASNRGIDDVRRLREVVGYAPMDGRHKIFIIDEAHMLSKDAFNALLKTLEEPPPRVVFILATTEPHKFPATVLSRCQHFVFQRLPEKDLRDHLAGVLQREGLPFEENAVRLIARRGSGSVRDAMSLLAQVLALGESPLTEETARTVLGLAGRETLSRMLDAFRDGDCPALTDLVRGLLDQGLDLGFFLRELSSLWRDLFILRQTGKSGLSATDLPEAEALALLETAGAFSLAHIHACWQMTLEGQRRVLTAQEPALALELLLLNLALLPRLLPLESLSGRNAAPPQAARTPAAGTSAPEPPAPPSPAGQNTAPPSAPGDAPAAGTPAP